MAQFPRLLVCNTMIDTGLVPVFYHADVEVCKQVVKACYDGGARVFEFTNRGDMAHEVFRELVFWANNNTPEMIIGVGSVIDAGTASLYIQLGANFVVSPIINADVARVCNRRKIAWSPGCGTVTEISYAEELGAEIVKIFPGSQVGGPGFVKAVKGPMPWTNIMPTGGVSPDHENLQAWFNAGVCCVGMGSQLIKKETLKNGAFEELKNTVRQALQVIMEIRNKQ